MPRVQGESFVRNRNLRYDNDQSALFCVRTYFMHSNKNNDFLLLDCHIKPVEFIFKNASKPNILKQEDQLKVHLIKSKENTMSQQLFMFITGALTVSLLNRKNEIFSCIKNKVNNLNSTVILTRAKSNFKLTLIMISAAIITNIKMLSVILKRYIIKLKIVLDCKNMLQSPFKKTADSSVLEKIKDINEERKKLAQLLITAINDNKNIRMHYQLESMAKSRLVHHIEKTEQQAKENRSRYFNFQQMYLLSNQENMFLKSRIMKLTKEKEDAEKYLMALLKEIYKSKNKELKDYCSRFIVKSKENLLNADIKTEIEKYLQKAHNSATRNKSIWRLSKETGVEINTTRSWSSGNGLITKIIEEDCLIPLFSNSSKPQGLPGEYIWTVKDKNGLIEKLYEYNYESDFNNGDTVRRIREYSVYHDQDCLLDFDR